MTLMKRAARAVTPEIATVAKAEGIEPEVLRRRVAAGRAVIPANHKHGTDPLGIGEGLRVKVNANLGTSSDHIDLGEEVEKAKVAVKYGADTVMDLSTGGDITAVRRAVLRAVNCAVGSVPIYQAACEATRKGSLLDLDEDTLFNAIELHAKDGVDFMTVHCGVNKASVGRLKRAKRLTDVVSRGGSLLAGWISHTGKENPLYENYGYLLELAAKYDFTLSLGDGLRPGSTADASDRPQLEELLILGELVDEARKAGVSSMVEGPGHVPLNQIEANIRMEKTVCRGAPFYVLGPLVTDVAPGYDHITSAIGGALAAFAGADYLCYVTPAEHLGLPTAEEVREGVIACRIAAHAADLARGRPADVEWANSMSAARRNLDWGRQFKLAIDSDRAREVWGRGKPKKVSFGKRDAATCTMCGDICAFRMDQEYLGKTK